MKALLIPSATLIPKEMRGKFGEIPTILYPLNNIPLIEHLYRQYKDIVDYIYVIAYKKKEFISDYINIKKYNIKIIELDQLKDIGYTILTGINAIQDLNKIDELYINFADTLISCSIPKDSDTVFYDETELNSTWTFFVKDEDNYITKLFDKKETDYSYKTHETFPYFIGIFSIHSPQLFRECLLNSVSLDNSNDYDSFYSALKQYSQIKTINYIKTKDWFDVGHAENYLKAKTGVQARIFNSIEIDETRGILKKRSANVDKFINEINWYLKLPQKLQYLTPRIYEYSLSRDNPYVSMECYGYHTLHEMFLYGNLPLYKWEEIFKHLKFLINDMEQYSVKNKNEVYKSMKEMYINKTLSRLHSLKKNDDFLPFFTKPIVINGVTYRSLNEYVDVLPKIIENELLSDFNDTFYIIHGDLCFSNILIDETYGFMRFIDPRGEFGSFDIYGDPKYEMAKLLHSIEGKYDFIIEDLFTINVNENKIDFLIQNKTDAVSLIFKNVFEEELIEYIKIKLIESTLFLSMIPLHSDYKTRQYAMLATGVQLFEQVLEKVDYEQ